MDNTQSVREPASTDDAEVKRLHKRLSAVEERLASLSSELRTRRLVVTGEDGSARLVAEVVANVLELRAELQAELPGPSGQPPDGCPAGADGGGAHPATGQRCSRGTVLIFANPGQADLAHGVGLQVWGDGDLVRELSWWADESASRQDQPAPAPSPAPSSLPAPGSEIP